MAKSLVTPAITALPKVTPGLAKPPKMMTKPAMKASKPPALTALFGKKNSRPSVQSVPTRTPSF